VNQVSEITADAQAVLHFAGQVFEPLPSGAVFWPARNTLLVADLHLEKMSSFARGGHFLPPYDTGMTLQRLEADLTVSGAASLIALGDSFHRDDGVFTLQQQDRALLDCLVSGVDWIWLSGNHDPTPHALGGVCAPFELLDGIRLTHEPEAGDDPMIAGHLHPSARVSINGRSKRSACCVSDGRLMILPAYGSSTGNLNILGVPFHGLLDYGRLQVRMLGRNRVYPISEKRLCLG